MKNNKMQEILNLSSLTMVDPEYTQFTNYIKKEFYNDARIFISDYLEELHEKLEISDDAELVDQIKRCNRLEDLVIDFLIGADEKEYDREKRTRPRIKR